MAAANQPLDASSPSDQIAERRWGELIIEGAIRVAGISSIVIIGLIFLFLLREGLPAFLDIPLRQLFGPRWYPIEEVFGLLPLLVGSLIVTVGAVAISLPLGLATAIYLGEIAPPWLREFSSRSSKCWPAFPPSCWAFSAGSRWRR
jgi:ABC-type phosphate transport system permease subunit